MPEDFVRGSANSACIRRSFVRSPLQDLGVRSPLQISTSDLDSTLEIENAIAFEFNAIAREPARDLSAAPRSLKGAKCGLAQLANQKSCLGEIIFSRNGLHSAALQPRDFLKIVVWRKHRPDRSECA